MKTGQVVSEILAGMSLGACLVAGSRGTAAEQPQKQDLAINPCDREFPGSRRGRNAGCRGRSRC